MKAGRSDITELNIALPLAATHQRKDPKSDSELTSTYDAPKFAAEIKDCDGQKHSSSSKVLVETHLDGIFPQLQ